MRLISFSRQSAPAAARGRLVFFEIGGRSLFCQSFSVDAAHIAAKIVNDAPMAARRLAAGAAFGLFATTCRGVSIRVWEERRPVKKTLTPNEEDAFALP